MVLVNVDTLKPKTSGAEQAVTSSEPSKTGGCVESQNVTQFLEGLKRRESVKQLRFPAGQDLPTPSPSTLPNPTRPTSFTKSEAVVVPAITSIGPDVGQSKHTAVNVSTPCTSVTTTSTAAAFSSLRNIDKIVHRSSSINQLKSPRQRKTRIRKFSEHENGSDSNESLTVTSQPKRPQSRNSSCELSPEVLKPYVPVAAPRRRKPAITDNVHA